MPKQEPGDRPHEKERKLTKSDPWKETKDQLAPAQWDFKMRQKWIKGMYRDNKPWDWMDDTQRQ